MAIEQLLTTATIHNSLHCHRSILFPGYTITINPHLHMTIRHDRLADDTYETTCRFLCHGKRIAGVLPENHIIDLGDLCGKIIVLRAHRLDEHGRPVRTHIEVHSVRRQQALAQ